MHCDVIAINKLISDGLDPNEKHYGWYDSFPLGWAATFGQLPAVIELILNGANPFIKNKAEFTAITEAKREKHVHIVKFLLEFENILLEQNFKNNTFFKLDLNTKIWLLEYPVTKNKNYNRCSSEFNWFDLKWKEKWSLHRAAMRDDVFGIKQLVFLKGKDPNEKMRDWYDSVPLGLVNNIKLSKVGGYGW